MQIHHLFIRATMPGIFGPVEMTEAQQAEYKNRLQNVANITPTEFFSLVKEFMHIFAPSFDQERKADTQDVNTFYATKFATFQQQNA
jgi:hypothetical protein